jgi:hypothetical protein
MCYTAKNTWQEAYIDRVYSNICCSIQGDTVNSRNLKYYWHCHCHMYRDTIASWVTWLYKMYRCFDPTCIDSVFLLMCNRLKWQHFRLQHLHMILPNRILKCCILLCNKKQTVNTIIFIYHKTLHLQLSAIFRFF